MTMASNVAKKAKRNWTAQRPSDTVQEVEEDPTTKETELVYSWQMR